MLWTLVFKHVHLHPKSLNSEYVQVSVKYIIALDANHISVHKVEPSFKGFSTIQRVSARECGGGWAP